MRGRDTPSVTKLHSSTSLTLIIGDPSTPALSQEIDIPLPNPVSTPPSAQVPPPPTQTPPGADVASQRQVNAQAARDEDVPMFSQMAERASSPRMEDVASSQDIQGDAADADGDDEDDPSSGRHNHPAQKESGQDGSSFTHMPLSVFSPHFLPPFFPPHLVPTFPDSTDYDNLAAPIRAGPSLFRFLLSHLPFAHLTLEDLPPRLPGDVVHSVKLSAAPAADRGAFLSFISSSSLSSSSLNI